MTLLADLRSGTYGLRFNPPSSLDLEVDQDTFTSLRDEEHRVDWYLEFSPVIVDLSIGHDDILREDLRIDTIAVFESYFEKSRKGSGSSAAESLFSEPRTRREPTWSPVVSVERITFCGVPALEVIHRLESGKDSDANDTHCFSHHTRWGPRHIKSRLHRSQ